MKKKSACFLRGINVSGKNMVRMAELTKLFMKAGFEDVVTYLQSGNVIFTHEHDLSQPVLSETISSSLKQILKTDIPVVIRDMNGLEKIISGNRFIVEDKESIDKLYVTLLGSLPDKGRVENLLSRDYTPERLFMHGAEVYICCPDGYGRAKLNNNYLEKVLGVTCTTRNWKTILAVNELIHQT